MRARLAGFVVCGAIIAPGGGALAHHSSAMFDLQHKIEIQGTVREFKFVSPHTFIVLEVKGDDGSATVWTLEGNPPAGLSRDGWSRDTLVPGDKLKLKIGPLRSGAPGGWYTTEDTQYQDGTPIIKGGPQAEVR